MEDPNIKKYRIGNLVIKIDSSKCISCGTCAALAPNTFEMDENLIAKVKDQGPYDNEETIKSAQASCSGGAITIEIAGEPSRGEVPQEPVAGKPDFHQPQ